MRQKWMPWIKGLAALAVVLLVVAIDAATARASDTVGVDETPVLKTPKERASYGLGVEMGKNLKRQWSEADLDIVVRGMKDAMTGDKLLLTDEELQVSMNNFAAAWKEKQHKDRLIAAQKNKKDGEAFLAANKDKEGVITLPSGLQYKILKAGDGKKPGETDTVECRCRGTFINGTEFVSTTRTGKPATFKLLDPNLIVGLRDALKLMPVGSTWQLFIPPQLAYLEQGLGDLIGPNATLIFEMEILAVNPAEAAAQTH